MSAWPREPAAGTGLVVGALATVYLVGGIGCDAAIPGGAPGWRLALYLGGLVAL